MKSCYVHIPFCASICSYCAFYRRQKEELILEQWLERITAESRQRLEEQKEKDPSFSLSTLYFGGGTPNVLSGEQFEKLARCFLPYLADHYEFTVECNPELVSLLQMKQFKKLGVNRISLGVQTFSQILLRKIGRHHTPQQAEEAIVCCRAAGITNISADLMYALPDQSLEQVMQDVDAFLQLDLPHLSMYSLQIEENSLFGKQGLEPIDEELEADMYEAICRKLMNAGYQHYEISSFCRQGFHSRHNVMYWQDEDWLAIGPGACGRDKHGRYENQKSLSIYINEGAVRQYVPDSRQDAAFEAVMMGLRSVFGLNVNRWNQKYGRDFEREYADVLQKWIPEYLMQQNTVFLPTQKGMELLNTILLDFLPDSSIDS